MARSRSSRSLLLLTLLALGTIAVVPARSLGSSAGTVTPTGAERAAILKAFGDPKAAAPCLVVRLAASNRDYGTVGFRGVRSCQRWAFNGVNVFKRNRDNRWKLIFAGSGYRCPVARIPRLVQRDLGVCP